MAKSRISFTDTCMPSKVRFNRSRQMMLISARESSTFCAMTLSVMTKHTTPKAKEDTKTVMTSNITTPVMTE